MLSKYVVFVQAKFGLSRRVEASSPEEAKRIIQKQWADCLDQPNLNEIDSQISDCGYDFEVLEFVDNDD